MATQPMFNAKPLFWISLAVVCYFGFVYLNHYFFKIDFVLLGVIQEMMLFPLMALQLVLLLLAIKNLITAQFPFKTYSFLTVCVLLTSSILTWGSFFVQ